MNRKIILGSAIIFIGFIEFVMYLSGYKSNTFIPAPIGFGILLIGGILLILQGRKERK